MEEVDRKDTAEAPAQQQQLQLSPEQQKYVALVQELVNAEGFVMHMAFQAALSIVSRHPEVSPLTFSQFGADNVPPGQDAMVASALAVKIYENVRRELEKETGKGPQPPHGEGQPAPERPSP